MKKSYDFLSSSTHFISAAARFPRCYSVNNSARLQGQIKRRAQEKVSVRAKVEHVCGIDFSPWFDGKQKSFSRGKSKEQPTAGLIHHSDQGSQYTSKDYRRLLDSNGITGSMSRKGNPYDNAPMESFFQTLKTECLYKQTFSTIEQTGRCLKSWIDVYYNCRRLHSALGYKSPLFYEISRIHPFLVSA